MIALLDLFKKKRLQNFLRSHSKGKYSGEKDLVVYL